MSKKINVEKFSLTAAGKKIPLDSIAQYLMADGDKNPSDFGLTNKDVERIERLNYTDNLIRIYRSTKKVMRLLQEKFGYSSITARRDIYDSKTLFGSIHASQKDYDRLLYIEWLEEVAKKALEQTPPNFNAYTKCMALIKDFGGFDKPEHEVEPFEPHQIIIQYNPELLGRPRIENLDEVMAKYLNEKARPTDEIPGITDVKIIDNEAEEGSPL